MDNDTQVPNASTQVQVGLLPPVAPLQAPRPTNSSKLPIIVVVLLILAVATGVGGYLYGSSSSNHSSTASTTPANWQPLPSSKKGFPIEGDDNRILTYYSLEEGKLISLDSIKLSKYSGNGSLGMGSGTPVASPSLNHIAFIGEDGNLWLFSVETQQTKQLTTNGLVSLITGWSPDSKNILYHYDRRTIASSSWGIDVPPIESVSFKTQVEQGFYQINIETGETTPLAPVESTEGYLDNNTLLVRVEPDGKKLAAFNIDTHEADLSTIKIEAGFGVGQFNFSPDGTKWAFANPIDKIEPTKGLQQLVFGNYPNATTVIDSGNWAEVQKPLFSPDSQKIAYQKRTGADQDQVWVYDIASGARKAAGDGSPVRWLDQATVLIRTSWDQEGQKLSTLNIETGEVTAL